MLEHAHSASPFAADTFQVYSALVLAAGTHKCVRVGACNERQRSDRFAERSDQQCAAVLDCTSCVAVPLTLAQLLQAEHAIMALSILVDFVKPMIRANMEDPEVRRQKEREYTRHREEVADF